jgi:hypothetical protein
MDSTGIMSLAFLKTKKLRIVSIGERHHTYDITRSNILHEWLNPELLSRDSSYMLVEDLYFKENKCAKDVVPRYFKKENIVSCDDIRENILLLIDNQSGLALHLRYHFMSKYPRESTIISPPLIDEYMYKIPVSLEDLLHDRFKPCTTYFVSQAKKHDNMYNRLKGDNADLNYHAMYEYTKTERNTSMDYRETEKLTKDLLAYNMYMQDYVYNNFIYMTVNWIVKQVPHITPSEAFTFVTGRLRRQTDFCKELYAANFKSNNVIFDFIVIQHVLSLYDTNAEVIYISSGCAHNRMINIFLFHLFKYVGFFESINEFRSEQWDLVDMNEYEKKPISSPDFIDFVNKNPEYGIRAPPVVEHIILDVPDANLDFFITILVDTYNIPTETQAWLRTNLSGVSTENLHFIFNMILTQEILKPQDAPQLYTVLKDMPLIGRLMDIQTATHRVFKNEMLSIFIKTMSDADIRSIPPYTFISLINEPESINFSKLREGADLLTLEKTSSSINTNDPDDKPIPSDRTIKYMRLLKLSKEPILSESESLEYSNLQRLFNLLPSKSAEDYGKEFAEAFYEYFNGDKLWRKKEIFEAYPVAQNNYLDNKVGFTKPYEFKYDDDYIVDIQTTTPYNYKYYNNDYEYYKKKKQLTEQFNNHLLELLRVDDIQNITYPQRNKLDTKYKEALELLKNNEQVVIGMDDGQPVITLDAVPDEFYTKYRAPVHKVSISGGSGELGKSIGKYIKVINDVGFMVLIAILVVLVIYLFYSVYKHINYTSCSKKNEYKYNYKSSNI